MPTRPRIFVSAVSREFATARKSAARELNAMGYDTVSEADFPTGDGELCDWLRTQIDDCDGLIQLVGLGYGDDAPTQFTGMPRMSYTQWERAYAKEHDKKVWIFDVFGPALRDTSEEALDWPDTDDDAWKATGAATPEQYQAEKRALQRAYVETLKDENALQHPIEDAKDLSLAIRNLRDDLGELRAADTQRERRYWRTALASLIGIAVIIGLLVFSMARSDRVTEAKVRAQLVQAIEQTYERELAAADGLERWEERDRGRRAAEAGKSARLEMVDAIASGFSDLQNGETRSDVLKEMERIVANEGVDEAIKYVATQRDGILELVRARRTQASAANRRDMQPLLQQAVLLDTEGKAGEARAQFEEILSIEPDWIEALDRYFWFAVEQGDRAELYGSLADAHTTFLEALATAQSLTKLQPDNTEWQRDLSVSHNRIGDVLRNQGDGPGALAAYQRGQDIAQALAELDTANTLWQRDLSISHNKIGDVLRDQGDGLGALAAYQRGLDIAEALAEQDTANTLWQRDLSICHERIGDVLLDHGDVSGALAAYQRGLHIRETLAEQDTANTLWQRDLSISHERIGDVLRDRGDGTGALAAYQRGLHISQALAEQDTANTLWQRDLLISHERIGDVLRDRGDGTGALAAYQRGLRISQALAEQDTANTLWQRGLSVSHNKIGDVLRDQGDGAGALAAYQSGLHIREALAELDSTNIQWQRDLALSFAKIAISGPLSPASQRSYLNRSRGILSRLESEQRLAPTQNFIPWIDELLAEIADE